jgi:hypothetical protein
MVANVIMLVAAALLIAPRGVLDLLKEIRVYVVAAVDVYLIIHVTAEMVIVAQIAIKHLVCVNMELVSVVIIVYVKQDIQARHVIFLLAASVYMVFV